MVFRSLYCCTSILLFGDSNISYYNTMNMHFYCCSWFSSSVIPNNVMNQYSLYLVVAFVVIVVLSFLTIRDHGLPTYLCCASTIAFPLSNPKCVTHLPFPVCLYITYEYSVYMYFYCCPCIRPSINMILRRIHLINTWISEELVIVLHLILPYHSMVYQSSFVLLLFYNFLFLVQYINSIFPLPSAITFCLTIP